MPPLCLVLLECVGSSYHVYALDILIVGMVVVVAPVEYILTIPLAVSHIGAYAPERASGALNVTSA